MNTKGYLVIEVLIAVVVFTMVALSVFSTISFSLVRAEKSQYTADASLLVQEGIEATYNVMLARDITNGSYRVARGARIPPLTGVAWDVVPATSETDIQTMFTRVVQVLPVCRQTGNGELMDVDGFSCPTGSVTDTNARIIRSEVRWQESGHDKQLEGSLLVLTI